MIQYDELRFEDCSDVLINNESIDDEERKERIRYWFDMEFVTAESCPFCFLPLRECIKGDGDPEGITTNKVVVGVKACYNCAYWQSWVVEPDQTVYGCPTERIESRIFKLREFDTDYPDEFVTEIAHHMRCNPKFWHEIEPTRLEKFVAAVMKVKYGRCNVRHVGRPDDGGIDVLVTSVDGRTWPIQVKRREHAKSTESVSTIRNFLGTMFLQDFGYGVVVSTADHFSARAFDAVENAATKGKIVKLVDKHALDGLIEMVLPDQPWLEHLEKNYPEYNDIFSVKLSSRGQLPLFR